MQDRTRRWVLTGGALVTAMIIGVGAAMLWGGGSGASPAPQQPQITPPGTVAQQFVTAFGGGDSTKAAGLTDAAPVALATLSQSKSAMSTSAYDARLGPVPPVPEGTTTAAVTADVAWVLPNDKVWKYQVSINMKLVDKEWKVQWAPTVLHPKLAEGQHLAFQQVAGEGAVLGRDGAPLAPGTVPGGLLAEINKEVGALQGSEGWQVGIADTSGAIVTALDEQKGVVAEKVTVTIDPVAQKSAQAAVDALPQGAAIVAIDASTAEILAVAQNEQLSGTNPFSGRYPPGSTFKIVTAAAIMQNGLAQPGTMVACPAKATIGTRKIENLNFGFDNDIPFRQAFAKSCNTTFAELGNKLDHAAVSAAARQFGLGADYTMPGATTVTGKVPPSTSGDERVENSFGQGTVEASPFGMALVAATVKSGRTPTPTLLRGKVAEATGGAKPPSTEVLNGLRAMMGDVVQSGTAQELKPFGDVRGKTGTAESSAGSHGWFVGYRGNLAFAVFVQGAGSSKPAVDATRTFLSGIR